MKQLDKFKVSTKTSIRDAVKQMDVNVLHSLVVMENNIVVAVFTMGDFRRAVIHGLDINNEISTIINRSFIFLKESYTEKELLGILNKNKLINDIPVLDSSDRLIDIISRAKHVTEKNFKQSEKRLEKISVVIMAGGKGTRMDPFTRILPKPLIPIGNKPIIQEIMDEFKKYGLENFYISINEKGQMIRAYFHDHELPYNIGYIEENKPLGTAGALLEMKDKCGGPVFVSNCDILIHTDYLSILDFHINGNYDVTLVASMRHYVIPYGVCDVDNGGALIEIKEKPEYDFLVNTGLYILEPTVLNLIPENTHFDMTDLINKVKSNQMSVGVYPVSEKSWKDVGQWAEYKKTLDEFVN